MTNNTLDRPATEGVSEAVSELRHIIEERFPAEAAGADMTNKAEIIRLATELVERLWRWEN